MPDAPRAHAARQLQDEARNIAGHDPLHAHALLGEALARTPDDDGAQLARLLLERGALATIIGNFDSALQDLVRAKELAVKTGEHELETLVQCRIANIHILQGLYPDALAICLDALREVEHRGGSAHLARLRNSLGFTYHFLGEQAKAREQLQACVALARAQGDRMVESLALDSLANTELAEGQVEAARASIERSILLLRELGNEDYLSEYLITLAQVVEAGGGDGRTHLVEALALSRRLQLQRHEAQTLYHLGRLDSRHRRLDTAQMQLEQALALADRIGDGRLGYLCCHALSTLFKGQRRYREALQKFEAYHQRKEALRSDTAELRIRYLEIRHRTVLAEQQKEQAQLRNQALEAEVRRREALQKEAERLARFDALTGIYNRRHFRAEAGAALEQCAGNGQDACLVLFDADHFKQINDNWGHAIGDLALQEISRTLQEGARQGDLFGRYGGEEFVMLLPGAAPHQALAAAQRMLERISVRGLLLDENTLPLSMSAGVALWQQDMSLDALIRRADEALYKAKAQGRNRVVLAT
ncbi:tetratricopeptide repeat-containing diguanylate cyclase [Crenobacter caeni]|uniref:diguanylate cyclase n=1 Tax=Crenobacter caeni TaxID=2705474 RepID=A0A6B2KVH6_9NEIS|nr:tetratricopeptide repeat-containing diguanylate cyclase [Crenobacter caeni]NDV14009.1 diguanylate cyclase [Crenobacter caeni]